MPHFNCMLNLSLKGSDDENGKPFLHATNRDNNDFSVLMVCQTTCVSVSWRPPAFAKTAAQDSELWR